MQLYRKILVTIDCSAADEAIISHISALAQQNKAGVTLLHVVHSHTLDQNRTLKIQAESCLGTYRERLKNQGIDTSVKLRSGEPEKEILDEIGGHDYDLVAMATHGHTWLGDLLFGSVSRSLKHKIKVPLLLIKQDTD